MIKEIARISALFIVLSPNLIFAQDKSIPCPRNQPVVAYHQEVQAMFMFGGFCSVTKKRLNDLWKFDEGKWVAITPNNSPEARSGHSMVYDSNENRLILFGGKNNSGQWLNDTWSWDGENWSMITNLGPSPRQSHRITFNKDDGSVFLFGGSNAENKSLDDTWVLKENTWVQKTSRISPPARLQHTMAYDSNRKKMVLFGGFSRSDNGKVVYGDTWEWDTETGWKLMNDQAELARDHHAMVYDVNLKRTVLFGGYKDGYLGDTRSWTGNQWEQINSEGPSKRSGKPGLFYNSVNKSLTLFGGGGATNMYLADFWELKGSNWRKIN